MRRVTRGGLLLLTLCLAVAACDKGTENSPSGGGEQGGGGSGGNAGTGATHHGTTETAQNGTGAPRLTETYYEEAERAVAPQDRAQRDLRGMFDTTLGYWDNRHAVPASVTRTPATVPCGDTGTALVATDWESPTWRALRFTPRNESHYSYQWDSTPITDPATSQVVGATFTASAFGDLDCDGVLSTFVRRGTMRDGGSYGGPQFNGDTDAQITNRDE